MILPLLYIKYANSNHIFRERFSLSERVSVPVLTEKLPNIFTLIFPTENLTSPL